MRRKKVSAEDLHRVLPLLYGIEVGDADEPFIPDLDDLYARMKVDLNDLDGEMTEQSALHAWWAVLAGEAEFEAGRCERALNSAEAQVVARLREEGMPGGVIHDMRKGEPEYVAAHDRHLIALRASNILRSLVRSLEHRREMLVAMSYRRGREYESARNSV